MLNVSCSTTPPTVSVSSSSLTNLQKQTDCPKPNAELTTISSLPVLGDSWYQYSEDWLTWAANDINRNKLLNKWLETHKCYSNK
jgi:hypothetical protein